MSLVLTKAGLQEVANHYSKVSAFAFDVETVGPHRGEPIRNDVMWLSLACAGRTDVIPMGHPHGEFIRYDKPLTAVGKARQAKGLPLTEKDERKTGWTTIWGPAPDQLTVAEVFAALEPVFFGRATKIAHSAKFDLESIAKYYGRRQIPGPYFCTVIATLLINSLNRGRADLASVVKREIGFNLEKGVGKQVEIHPFSVVYKYSYLDSKMLWLAYLNIIEKLDKKNMAKLMKFEMDFMDVIVAMEMAGAPVDKVALQELHDYLIGEIDVALTDVYREAGFVFNVSSNPTLAKLMYSPKSEGGRGLRPLGLTDAGVVADDLGLKLEYKHYSVDVKALEPYASKDPLVDVVVNYKELNKLFNTYVLPYNGGIKVVDGKADKPVESLLVNGRIYAKFNQMGADTSRVSCVAGSTLLPTSRGTFSFEEYIPMVGDRVVTHAGRWMPVVRKVYKGISEMFQVTLDNGSTLHCTMFHRLLTLDGWVALGDLIIGDEVASYVDIESVLLQTRESRSSIGGVPVGGSSDNRRYSGEAEHESSQHLVHPQEDTFARGLSHSEGEEIRQVQAGNKEPYEGQEWFPSPQLCGGDIGWTRISTGEGRKEVRVLPPVSHGQSFGTGKTAGLSGSTPHQRGQEGQSSGQSRLDDLQRSHHSSLSSSIISIKSLGPMGVWDIEVEGDHSYLTQGFVSHNSSQPNLQNVPNAAKSENGKKVRNVFWAPPGYKMIVADYSQIEPRIIASFSGDAIFRQVYLNGEDIYLAIAEEMGTTRPVAKVLMLAVSYGTGPETIMQTAHCNKKAANGLLDSLKLRFPDIEEYKKKVYKETRNRTPHCVTTILGHRRYIPDISSTVPKLRSRAERQAFNTKIQGSAADIIKLAMIRCHTSLPEGAKMIITVHDEILTLAPIGKVEETQEVIRASMEDIDLLTVPLVADIKVVDRWGEAK